MNASTRPVFSFRIKPLSKHSIIMASANRKRADYQPADGSLRRYTRELQK